MLLRQLLFAAYLIVLGLLSLLPAKEFSPYVFFTYQDLLAHVCMYFGFAFLVSPLLPPTRVPRFVLAVLFAVALGGAFELAQASFPALNRHGSWLDATANTLGALLGAAVAAARVRVASSRRS